MTQLQNSWGERSLLWHCRLIWGGSLYRKSKTPRGRMVGLSGHPYKTPQDPGREAESPGSGLPLQKYRRGRGSSRELSQRLSSQRNSFQGNVSLSPSTEEPSLSAPWQSWTLDLSIQGFPQHGLFFFAAASLRTDAAVGRSGRVSTHTVSCYNPNIH